MKFSKFRFGPDLSHCIAFDWWISIFILINYWKKINFIAFYFLSNTMFGDLMDSLLLWTCLPMMRTSKYPSCGFFFDFFIRIIFVVVSSWFPKWRPLTQIFGAPTFHPKLTHFRSLFSTNINFFWVYPIIDLHDSADGRRYAI